MQGLEKKLNYTFENKELLDHALRHRSMGRHNNERLEFLGDAALGLVIGAELYTRFSNSDEGDLTRLRSWLVRKDTLAKIARMLDIGSEVRLESGEMKSGGHRRDSILADAVEAIYGAVYLDKGFEACRKVILHVYQPLWDELPELDQLKDAKTRLQEWLQSRGRQVPKYSLVSSEGPDHAKTFQSSCELDDKQLFVGQAGSRRIAEQIAAANALKSIS